MIGFAADNVSVMMVHKVGLKAKLKEHLPNLFVVGCVCHSTALCSDAACTKVPGQAAQLARDVCNYFGKMQCVELGSKKHKIFWNLNLIALGTQIKSNKMAVIASKLYRDF